MKKSYESTAATRAASVVDPALVTLNEHEASAITGFAVKTLQRRRWEGLPPVFLKIGRKVRYRLSDLQAYLDACTVAPVRRG